MTSVIQKIARAAFQTFSSVNDTNFHDNLFRLKETARTLTARDVNFVLDFPKKSDPLIPDSFLAPASYTDIYHNRVFTMGIFALRNEARIPLHDHPGMYGILKVIYGKLLIKSFTKKKDEEVLYSHDNRQRIPVIQHDDVVVGVNDDVCFLTPTEGNFHEVQSVDGPAAFVDILGPPYIPCDRDCHYYRLLKSNAGLYIEEIEAPMEFWTSSGVYEGPPITENFENFENFEAFQKSES